MRKMQKIGIRSSAFPFFSSYFKLFIKTPFVCKALIKELSARNDNPYIDTLPVGDKCFREDYIVGRIVPIYISKDNSFQDIDVDSVYNTIEEAESRLDKLGYEYQVFIRRILKSGI